MDGATLKCGVRRLLLVVGPESTGTRVFTQLLSSHPDVFGTPLAQKHGDILDEVWIALSEGANADAQGRLHVFDEHLTIATRRSLPHGQKPGKAAVFMQFPPLKEFIKLAKDNGREPVLLITTRSPLGNVISWARERSSAKDDPGRAMQQYWGAYRCLFEALCNDEQTPFFFLSLEALALEGEKYASSLLRLLGLRHDVRLGIQQRPDVNDRRYLDPWLINPANSELAETSLPRPRDTKRSGFISLLTKR